MKWYSATEVAKLLNVATATVISHCEDGTMPAINIARESSKRRRWRISEDHLTEFQSKRLNGSRPKASTAGKLVKLPAKDYFANSK